MAEPALTENKNEGPARDIGGLDAILGFHIRLAHGAVYRHFNEAFAELELTQKQVSVLWMISDEPSVSQIQVGRRLRMDRATTMTIVNRLQERGYVRRERSESDRRKQALYLTDGGKAALDEAKICIESHESWLKNRFNDDEIEKLVEMLTRIHE